MKDICMHSKKVKHVGGKQVNWSGQDPIYLTKEKLIIHETAQEWICIIIMPYNKMLRGAVNDMESNLINYMQTL